MPTTKRAYLVRHKDDNFHIPVVAASAIDAKQIVFAGSYLDDCELIDLRCWWRRDANVDGLSVGVVQSFMNALRRDIYRSLEDATCDICGEGNTHVKSVNGKAVCEACIEEFASPHGLLEAV